jgi:hypothetical protein
MEVSVSLFKPCRTCSANWSRAPTPWAPTVSQVCCPQASPHGPYAAWRKLNGVEVFTGIVKLGETALKLDDPHGPLDGPGHKMCNAEFISQMAMYEGSETNRIQKPVDFVSFKDKRMSSREINYLDKYFETNPYDLVFFPFDELPGGGFSSRVRADDEVLISVTGDTMFRGKSTRTNERFFCHVMSVTPDGRITAVPMTDLNWADVGRSDPIWFPAEAVIASRKGAYWPEEE